MSKDKEWKNDKEFRDLMRLSSIMVDVEYANSTSEVVSNYLRDGLRVANDCMRWVNDMPSLFKIERFIERLQRAKFIHENIKCGIFGVKSIFSTELYIRIVSDYAYSKEQDRAINATLNLYGKYIESLKEYKDNGQLYRELKVDIRGFKNE